MKQVNEHIAVPSLKFIYILYIYSVTKNLHKIRAITFTENYGESSERVNEYSIQFGQELT